MCIIDGVHFGFYGKCFSHNDNAFSDIEGTLGNEQADVALIIRPLNCLRCMGGIPDSPIRHLAGVRFHN